MGWDPSRVALALEKKSPGIFFLTGTGLVDPVQDGKFTGNSLLGKGQSQKSAFQKAPCLRILAWTLYENKNSLGILCSYGVK